VLLILSVHHLLSLWFVEWQQEKKTVKADDSRGEARRNSRMLKENVKAPGKMHPVGKVIVFSTDGVV